ncbi:MAG: hydroxyacid dehydrogenase, partial [Limnohabitans sp.]|nr:hydroxyacid dehydrogenase [Limnohabitans sp.]
MKIFLSHTQSIRKNYYGDQAIAELQKLGHVTLHQSENALEPHDLIRACCDIDLIIADRLTTGHADIFQNLPQLKAFIRCAVDIRNIDTQAASQAGILVTRAIPGFVDSVCELALGFLVDLARGISRSVTSYHNAVFPEIRMRRQLKGSIIGIIGYGAIARRLPYLTHHLGMRVIVSDPYATMTESFVEKMDLQTLLATADHVVCLAVANSETENLMGVKEFNTM